MGYESVEPYPLEGMHPEGVPADEGAYEFYAVGDKKMRFGKPTPEQKAAGEKVGPERDHLQRPDHGLGDPRGGVPVSLGSRSAVEWIIDRYYVKTDKASGIVNDPNDWSREVGDPRYILDLLARVVRVRWRRYGSWTPCRR